MKQIVKVIILILFVELILQRCANPLTPKGGPKDTIPPNLIHSEPLNQTINFKEREIRLFFDEFINADKLRQKLIITPNTEAKYKHTVKKRDLIIKFDTPLLDSTTYTLNFFDGVTDITERNPAENLILAISTGTFIDSLKLFGSVVNLFTDEPSSKSVVGLYKVSDSLDIFKDSPYYFYTTDKNGTFQMNNIKSGKYLIVAFKDENKNLKLDEATEPYAYKKDTIDPSIISDSIKLKQITADASLLKFISARPTGKYFDARYNKSIVNYTAKPIDSLLDIYHALNSEKDAVRFYNKNNLDQKDSIGVILLTRDTIDNSSIDTVFVKFKESLRKADLLKQSTETYIPKGEQNIHFSIKSNKPISLINDNFLTFNIDTLYSYQLKASDIKYNHNKTTMLFDTPITYQTYTDTLNSLISKRQSDTLNIDSTKITVLRQLLAVPKNKILIEIAPNTIVTADNDTIPLTKIIHRFTDKEELGEIKVNISSSYTSYVVQLIDNKKEPVASIKNCQTCIYKEIKPGSYSVRVLIDNNQDGKWKIGNIREFIEPEQIIHFKEVSELRSNWSLELDYEF